MIVRGTWDWNLIKIETDSGLYGIGEAYWGWGVKDMVLNKLKPIIVGEDPLNVDKLYTKMLMQSAGAGAIGGRHDDRGQRHRDRAVGPLRAHSADPGVQSVGRPFPRPRAVLSDAAVRGRTWKIRAHGGRSARRRAPRSGAGRPSSSRAMACRVKADPEFREPGHDPYGAHSRTRITGAS